MDGKTGVKNLGEHEPKTGRSCDRFRFQICGREATVFWLFVQMTVTRIQKAAMRTNGTT